MNTDKPKNEAAQALGRAGGAARAASLTEARRKEIAASGGKIRTTNTHKNAEKMWSEPEDGWWAILKAGLEIDGCSGVHEETKGKLLKRLNDARKIENNPLA